ncbi:hypothetical protein L6452_03296 [Arctium lappa]|uniref:Uncharacterized protein n=1 Tax=Arctium lappa TaxID=4217 RepID=A0ACB9FN19_ARCLA|nr:hypothetical protein L6452_03296 [Arctium lappa]
MPKIASYVEVVKYRSMESEVHKEGSKKEDEYVDQMEIEKEKEKVNLNEAKVESQRLKRFPMAGKLEGVAEIRMEGEQSPKVGDTMISPNPQNQSVSTETSPDSKFKNGAAEEELFSNETRSVEG